MQTTVRLLVKYPVKVSMPPAIMRGIDTTYIVAGCMIPVPHDVTKEDMHKYVTYERPTHDVRVWKVKSSKGGNYTVRCYNGERYTCDCPGFKFHKKCKHVVKVAK